MNKIHHDIFRAIHEGKWLKIEYRNLGNEITKFWIGILDLDIYEKKLLVDGLHIGKYTLGSSYRLSIDQIISSEIVEGSYCAVNKKLVEDIYMNQHKYRTFFENVANLKILNYLEMCNRMDTTPYYSEFALIKKLDAGSFSGEAYQLSDEQFQEVVKNFQYKMEKKENTRKLRIQQLAMNVVSIHTAKGLYVLAYRKLELDVKKRELRPADEITVCTEFAFGEVKESIRRFLDADEFELLSDFETNQEKIKDCITKHSEQVKSVDDMPYIIGLGMDIVLDLRKEYEAIIKMYQEDKVAVPIKAFFGDLLARPRRSKDYPITLLNPHINLDQLLAIHNGMKYPLAYIQGPPGTGKTNTIINTIITAFFNERTVLFTSYNNHPINGVFEKLSSMSYRGKTIPFPVLMLGNVDKMGDALKYMKDIYIQVQKIQVFEGTLDKRKDDRTLRAKQLSELLKRYEELLEFKDRRDAIKQVVDHQGKNTLAVQMLPFQTDLQGRQLVQIEQKIAEAGEFTDEQAIALIDSDYEQLRQYLYYMSARYIKKLGNNQYKDLYDIVFSDQEPEEQIERFTKFLDKTENVKRLQKLFPIIITTCISAYKLGGPEPSFDMVIMDEASQCNTAISLVPIIRGENLMLVGDPQQLNPVILLDEDSNQKLRKKYMVADEYDYRKNSVYKTFLACDSVSDEVLLHNHYRCHEKIIGFNNKKYYNSKLKVCSDSKEAKPLVCVQVTNDISDIKNTAPAETDAIIDYITANKDKSIGIITPFVNQKKMIEEEMKRNGLENITCGTVHAFQGDEKDIILFSTVLTNQTQIGTYNWLKNNKELINVATSRARDKLVVMVDINNLKRLHRDDEDDLFELIRYVYKNGEAHVTQKKANSRALGVKPFSTATEEAFLENLSHALGNIWLSQNKYSIQKEVPIAQVFQDNTNYSDLFYSGRFDFVVYEKIGKQNFPVLAIELDGKEHYTDEVVKNRDRKKNEICEAHNLQIIRVENSYARRYNHIKEILLSYFSMRH